MPTDKEIAALVEALAEALVKGTPLDLSYAEATEAAEMAVATLTTSSDRASQGEGWLPIETAPHAMHVLACRFDDAAGEWVSAVVLSPPIYPFTHWRPLPAPPVDGGEG